MSESIPKPWIRKYFTDIAETFGAKIFDAPQNKKGQKVQIIEFLTYPDGSEDVVWAVVSDKHSFVPVKFTSEAMKQYNSVDKITRNQNKRLTSRKGCIATLKNFHPFFGRVPRKNMKDMGEVEHIALAIGFVHVIGAEQEGIFGFPKDIERDEDIALWVSGLREGGGGGNVLQQRKSAISAQFPQEQNGAFKFLNLSRPKSSLASPSVKTNNNALHLAEESIKKDLKSSTSKSENGQECNENGKYLFETWKSSWRHIGRAPLKYAFMPVEAEHALLNILVFGRDISTSESKKELEEHSPRTFPSRKFVESDEQECNSEIDNPPLDLAEELRHDIQQKFRQTTPTEWEASQNRNDFNPRFGDNLLSNQKRNPEKIAGEDYDTTTPFPDRDGQKYRLSKSKGHKRRASIVESTLEKITGTHEQYATNAANTSSSNFLETLTQEQRSPLSTSPFNPIISSNVQSAKYDTRTEQAVTSLQGQPEQIAQQSSLAVLPDSSIPESSRYSIPEASFTATHKSLRSSSDNNILSEIPRFSSPNLTSQVFLKTSEGSQDDQRPVRILVPDSDISGSASQEHAVSLSQSLLPPRDTKSWQENSTESIGCNSALIGAPRNGESQTQSETQSSSGLDYSQLDHLKGENDTNSHEQRQKPQTGLKYDASKPIEFTSSKFPFGLGYNYGTRFEAILKSASTLNNEKKLPMEQIEIHGRPPTLDIDDIHIYTMLEVSKAKKGVELSSELYLNVIPDTLHKNEASSQAGTAIVGISTCSGHARQSPTIRTQGKVEGATLGANVELSMSKSNDIVNSTDISQSSDAAKLLSSPVPFSKPERRDRGIDEFILHDPAAWKAPSFLGRKRKPVVTPAAIESGASSSSRSKSTSLVDDESRPAKKARMAHSEHQAAGFTESVSKKSKTIITLPKPHIMTTMHSLSALNTNNKTLPKLNGFVVNFNMSRSMDGPPWLTWLNTADILLKIGRTRYQEKKKPAFITSSDASAAFNF